MLDNLVVSTYQKKPMLEKIVVYCIKETVQYNTIHGWTGLD